MRNPRDFGKPLALGAPAPVREIPIRPSRMIHFFDPTNPKMAAKVPEMAQQADILLGNLEDAIPTDKKVAAREGLVEVAKEADFGDTPLWTRVNSLDSPWMLDDLHARRPRSAKARGHHGPKVEGPGTSTTSTDCSRNSRRGAGSSARSSSTRSSRPRWASPTSRRSPREPAHPGAQLRARRPRRLAADEDDARRRRPPRLPRRDDPDPDDPDAPRPTAQQDPWHYTIARMVDACAANGVLPFYGPFGDISDVRLRDQFRDAFLLGCVGAWSLHPSQIAIAKRVFSPRRRGAVGEERAGGDGRRPRRLMLDGKMQDDAT